MLTNTAEERLRTHLRKRHRVKERGAGPCKKRLRVWAIQGTDNGWLENGAPSVKNIGKPCAGEPHARFDEGGQVRACSLPTRFSLLSNCRSTCPDGGKPPPRPISR